MPLIRASALIPLIAVGCSLSRGDHHSPGLETTAHEAALGGAPVESMPAGAPAALTLQGSLASTVDEWYLRVNGCRLYVREFGRGDTVVVLHGGFGAEHGYLLDAVAGLENRYHFVFYDQRGSLRSPCADSTISVDRHIADLERLRQELHIDRLTLLGHSMGTFLAMRYLEDHPDRVGRMALLAPLLPRAPANEWERSVHAEQQQRFVQWTAAQEAKELAEEGLARPDSVLGDRQRTHKWRVGFAAANLYHTNRWRRIKGGQVFYDSAAGLAAGRTLERWDFTDDLAAHPYPVGMVLGDHDLVGFGATLHRALLKDLHGVTLVVVERAGHNAWVDRPHRVRSLIDRFLSGR